MNYEVRYVCRLQKLAIQKMKKPKNYYCHKSQSFQSPLPLVDNLEVVQKIGQGAFGEVYKVFDHSSSQLKVIKRHKRDSSKAIFYKQNEVMKQMSGSEGFAKVKQFYSQTSQTKRSSEAATTIHSSITNGKAQTKHQLNQEVNGDQMIMMECLGDNLSKVIEKKLVSIFTMKRIAQQLILRLRELHQKNYVHRDLKPENILLGNQLNPHKIYLVDFGLVSSYRKDPKKIRKMYDGLIGTAKYCPLASHYGYEQFPKDDLESLGYVLVYLIKGQLPWKFPPDSQMSDDQKFDSMRATKEKTSISQLTGGISCLKKYFTFVKGLQAGSKINYAQILQMFKTDSNQEYCFEFCRPNCIYKIKRQNQFQIPSENEQKAQETTIPDSIKKISIKPYFFPSKFKK